MRHSSLVSESLLYLLCPGLCLRMWDERSMMSPKWRLIEPDKDLVPLGLRMGNESKYWRRLNGSSNDSEKKLTMFRAA